MRLAIVVQRYGGDILGGAEAYAERVAQLLGRHHQVEVLTSTAKDYRSWSSVLPAGCDEEAGVRIRRFQVVRGRAAWWPLLHELLLGGMPAEAFARLSPLERKKFEERVRAWPDALQNAFLQGQGPHCPDLYEHLRVTPYDAHLFFTYLYPTTHDALAAIHPARAYIVPTFHDEPPALLPIVGRRLARARLLCSTQSEIALLKRLHPGVTFDARHLGYGIDLPEDRPDARPLEPPYLLFAGRIDPQKGIKELLEWYALLRQNLSSAPRLVLAGEVLIDLPQMPGVEAVGYVSAERKISLMRGALAFVHPSNFESLGIVLLEAAACRTPLLVNAACEPMVEICLEGRCGFPVRDGAELVVAVRRLVEDRALRTELGAAGRLWVEREFSLRRYEERLLEEFPLQQKRAN